VESQSSDCRRDPLWLPLADDTIALAAPISHPGAIELLAVIAVNELAADAGRELADATSKWKAILTREPGLAVWSVCRAHALDGHRLCSLEQAATWLVEHGRRELLSHWRAASHASAKNIPPAGSRWAELNANALQICSTAKASVKRGDAATSIAPWLKLLRDSKQIERWLRAGPDATWVPVLLAKLARLDRLERDFQNALEIEKLEAVKELAYGAGHEINNPLANISARAQTLLQDERDPERRRRLAAINAQAFRAHEMIADMMLFARPPAPRLARVALNDVAQQVLGSLATAAAEQATTLIYHAPPEPLHVNADATQMAVALRALLVNGLEALGEGGEVTLTLREKSAIDPPVDLTGTRRGVELVVTDNGPGIPDEIRPRLFDPYFSGREAGRGIGFGLCKSWRIVSGHGGSLSVANNPTGGASFTIWLPAL
jgi:signal transduction histidine kinase